MNTKHHLTLLSALLLTLCLHAQTYVGSLTTNSYTYKDATIVLTIHGSSATLLMHHVKFAKLMPVKVDVDIKNLHATKHGSSTTLTGDNIVPLSNGKPHKKYTIHNLQATSTPTSLSFRCLMGDKHISFKGQLAEKGNHTTP